MTRAEAKNFSKDLQDLLNQLGDKYNLNLKHGTIRFSDTEISTSLKGHTTKTNSEGVTPKLASDARNAYYHIKPLNSNITEEDFLTKKFKINGKNFTFVEYRDRKSVV